MIGLTTGLVMALTAFSGGSSHASALILSESMRPSLTTAAEGQLALADTFPEASTTEEVVRAYFKDTPILAEVSRCESQFRQYDSKGNILRGVVNKADVGVMQINEFYHGDTAKKLGLDLYTIEGNMAYAKYLYNKNGTSDWNASKPCWGKFAGK